MEEYYLTRCEFEILEKDGPQIIANHFIDKSALPIRSAAFNLIELGAGDGRKTRVLLELLEDQDVDCEYIPIDISKQAITDLFRKLSSYFESPSSLECTGIIGDHVDGLDFVRSERTKRKNVVLFLGSSIGNFRKDLAKDFLTTIRSKLNRGDILMIGFDLRKDAKVVSKAYCDVKGVSKEFNLNLLTRMNRELGANFDLSKFMHCPVYNADLGAMESYLVPTQDQLVTFTKLFKDGRNKSYFFHSQERLSTEYSFKYTEKIIEELAHASGFAKLALYHDSRKWFVDALWIAV